MRRADAWHYQDLESQTTDRNQRTFCIHLTMSFLRLASSGLRARLNSASRTSFRTFRTSSALADSADSADAPKPNPLLDAFKPETNKKPAPKKRRKDYTPSYEYEQDSFDAPIEPIYPDNVPEKIIKSWPVCRPCLPRNGEPANTLRFRPTAILQSSAIISPTFPALTFASFLYTAGDNRTRTESLCLDLQGWESP